MPCGQELAARIRALISREPGLSEKTMFGGLAFFISSNMAITASGHGGLMVRVDPAESDVLVSASSARVVEMRGRPMRGWLYLEAADVDAADELGERGLRIYPAWPAGNCWRSRPVGL
jgi:TfoX-like protein